MPRTWVIGGKRGIGAAIVQEIEKYGGPTLATDEEEADVRSTRQLAAVFHSFNPERIVYCAGVNKLMPAKEFDEFEALDILDINALGFMVLIGIVARCNDDVRPKSIVAITSDAATRPMRASMAYCASKAALNMAVRCAARELAPDVQVNGVAPGIVADTPMTIATDKQVEDVRHWTPEQAAKYETAGIPMGRRASAEEIASMVYSVLTAPQYLTGAIIEINGGR